MKLPQRSKDKEPDGEGPWSSSRASNEITKGSKGKGVRNKREVYISDVGFETVFLSSGN